MTRESDFLALAIENARREFDPLAPVKPTQLELPWNEQDRAVFSHAETVREAKQQRLRQAAAPASHGPRPFLTYPTVFVSAPRAVTERYAQEPWANVLDAAERGVDGLAVVTGRPRHWGGRQGEPSPLVPDVAFLAEGQGEWRGRTVLYQQNW